MYVCLCYPLTEDGIKELIKKRNIASLSDLVEATSAGKGCGTCTSSLKKIFTEVQQTTRIKSDSDFYQDLKLLSRLIVAHRVSSSMEEDNSLKTDIERLEHSIIEYAQGNKVSLLMSPSEDIREATTYILRRMKTHG